MYRYVHPTLSLRKPQPTPAARIKGFVAALFDTFEKRMGKMQFPPGRLFSVLRPQSHLCSISALTLGKEVRVLSCIGISCFMPPLLVLPKIDIKFELLDGKTPLSPSQFVYTTLQGGCSWIWFQQMNAMK
jgi:hypothetical protein